MSDINESNAMDSIYTGIRKFRSNDSDTYTSTDAGYNYNGEGIYIRTGGVSTNGFTQAIIPGARNLARHVHWHDEDHTHKSKIRKRNSRQHVDGRQ